MKTDNPSSNMQTRVRFIETDQMGIAHHSAYIAWFEMARIELFRDHGISYREWEDAGLSLGVSAVNLKYRQPALFDDVLTLKANVQSLRSRRIVFDHYIYRGEELLAYGETVHTPMNREGCAIRLPNHYSDELQVLIGRPRENTRGNSREGVKHIRTRPVTPQHMLYAAG